MIEVRQSKVYRGPSLFARSPVIQLTVDIGELEERPTDHLSGFADHLLALIPSLQEHRCSLGRPGGFVERMRRGTWMGHVLEHVALELQCLAGNDVSDGRTRGTQERGVYEVIYEYRQEDVGRAAGRLGLRVLNHLVYGAEPKLAFRSELEEGLIPLAERLAYGPSTAAIVDEAERRGIPALRLDPKRSLVQLGHGCFQQRIWATTTSRTKSIAVELATNKELTTRLLRDVGILVPRGEGAEDVEAMARAALRIGYPVVVKPLDGNHGRGVFTSVRDEMELRACFPVAMAESKIGIVVVEAYVTGKDYRILVVDGQVVAVAERVPAHVVGDGTSTVAELIEATNVDPRRGIGHEKVLTRITVDEQSRETLARQGMGLDDIPTAGQMVQLKRTANMSTGGTSIDRTDEIHPDNAELARQAAMTIGLDVAGIDFIAPDIAGSVWEAGGAIVEVNAAPGFRMHTHPTEGLARPVGRVVVDMLFAQGAPSRIPILAVTGTNGKTTTARMVAHIVGATGKRVGLTTTDGIFIDGRQIAAGDMAGPESARIVLKNPVVEAAVLECARGGILRSGLGFDRCDVGIVTNVASDHVGLGGVESVEELAQVNAVVPRAVFRDGASVLNAENFWTVEMARHARGEIVFFSLDEGNPTIQDHLRERGRAVVVRQTSAGDVITVLDHERATPILLADEIPATLNGRIQVNVANALAATAGALGLGISVEIVRNALRTFTNEYAQTPGRFNLIEIDGRQVVMDFCHNAAALETVADFVRRMEALQTVGVVTVPGDRNDAEATAFGRLAGLTFDRLVIREDADMRGRPRGQMAELLRTTASDAGMPASRITIVLDEVEAALAGVELARPGDLVVVMADSVSKVWQALQSHARSKATKPPQARHGHEPATDELVPAPAEVPPMQAPL